MRRADLEVAFGIGTLIAAAAFLTVAFAGSGIAVREGYELSAVFNRIDGIAIGSQVRLAGITVGEVAEVEFRAETGQAVVVMSLDPTVKVPRDTAVIVGSDGLMGDKIIKLDPGGAEEMLEPGDFVDITQDSVIIEEILEKIVLDAESRVKKRKEKAAEAAKSDGG